MPSSVSRHLLYWHAHHPRTLPWSDEKRNAYQIWLSEIIMQQTRLEQGAGYYRRFIAAYPDVTSLAEAKLDEVMRLWQGLGYYTRARNLHKTATIISREYHGCFPSDYNTLLTLPGIGSYSAAAISSFAFGKRHAVVDGNVKRLISRYYGIMTPIDDANTQKEIQQHADAWIKDTDPAEFNQAIMNFGAIICRPAPLCHQCPLASSCKAFQQDLIDVIPVRKQKAKNKTRHLHFLLITYRRKMLFIQRTEKDIWQGLYTPVCVESNSDRSPSVVSMRRAVQEWTGHIDFKKNHSGKTQKQLLTHQIIYGRFHYIELNAPPSKKIKNGQWLTLSQAEKMPKPRMITENLDSFFLKSKNPVK